MRLDAVKCHYYYLSFIATTFAEFVIIPRPPTGLPLGILSVTVVSAQKLRKTRIKMRKQSGQSTPYRQWTVHTVSGDAVVVQTEQSRPYMIFAAGSGGLVQRTEAAAVFGKRPRWDPSPIEFHLATLPSFLRVYCFDELCPASLRMTATDGGMPVLARRYDVDALLGVGETTLATGVGAEPFHETRWIDLDFPAGGDVWSHELVQWEDTKPAGRIEIEIRWEPSDYGA